MTLRITFHGATGSRYLVELDGKQLLVTHGEPSAADALRRRLVDELGWTVTVPSHGETQELA